MSSFDAWRGVLLAAHITFVMFWMAGLFYLPRLFVYHLEARAEGDARGEARLALQARKLAYVVATPAMLIAWVLGLSLAVRGGLFAQGWFHGKAAVALALTGYHLALLRVGWRLDMGLGVGSARLWRGLNEVGPALAVVAIALAVLKP